jgi:hypothetical protein
MEILPLMQIGSVTLFLNYWQLEDEPILLPAIREKLLVFLA